MDSDVEAAPMAPSNLQDEEPGDGEKQSNIKETVNNITKPAAEDSKITAMTENTKLTEVSGENKVTVATAATSETSAPPNATAISDIAEKALITIELGNSATQAEIVENLGEISDNVIATSNNENIIVAEVLDTTEKAHYTETSVKSDAIESQVDSTDINDLALESNVTSASEYKIETIVEGSEIIGNTEEISENENSLFKDVEVERLESEDPISKRVEIEDPANEKSLSDLEIGLEGPYSEISSTKIEASKSDKSLMKEIEIDDPANEIPLSKEMELEGIESENFLPKKVEGSNTEKSLLKEVVGPANQIPLSKEIELQSLESEMQLSKEIEGSESEMPRYREVEHEEPANEVPLFREIELAGPAKELEYSDDSVSDAGSDHPSGNECDATDSDSIDHNYHNARRTPPQQYGHDVASSDSDNCEATGDDGNEEQEVHEEVTETQEEPTESKESPQPPRKVDDDEDKNNPQYIPKRGTFYEHDYRTTEDVADAEKADPEKEKLDSAGDSKKKMWHDKREKWNHDKFKNDDQVPKSRDELIAIYGYDIRNEDGPPRARRRRRYGRGPNKYTRNWEDEDAYYKTSVKKPTQQAKGADQPQELEQQQPLQQHQPPQQQQESARQLRDNPRPGPKYFREQPQEREQHIHSQDARVSHARMQSAGTGRIIRPNRDYATTDYKSFTKARNYNRSEPQPQQQQYTQRFRNQDGNNSGGDRPRQQRQPHTSPGRRYQRQTSDNRDVNVKQLDAGMASLSLQQQQQQQQFDGDSNQQQQTERKPVVKRYSAMRHRALPDVKVVTLSEAFATQRKLTAEIEQRERDRIALEHFYEHQPPAGQVNVAMCAPPQLGLPSRQCLPDNALAQQLVVAGRQLHPQQQQQPFVGGVPTPPQFISPPPFLARPPQPPPININYQLAPQHYYQHQQAPPPPQFVPQPMPPMQTQQVATEQLFQPQGGITYYSPEEQQTTQRHVPPMRPKAAIPILPPPPTPPPNANNINFDM